MARAILLAGIALVALVVGGAIALAGPRRRDESAAIRARYGGLIIPVERAWQLPGVAVVDVADIEALARIAEHYDRSIVHELTDYGEAFWVTDESGQFRYWIGIPDGVPITSEPFTAPGQRAPTESNGWVEPSGEPDRDTAPTLEFTLGEGTNGAARPASAWTGGESVQHIEAPTGSESEPRQY